MLSSNATESSAEELLGQTTPTVDESTYFVSPGPIQARIRMATADIANGYTSCDDLKDDILNALKHLANSIIVDQSKNGWYYETNCGEDPTFIMEGTDMAYSAPAPSNMGAEAAMDGSTASKVTEDSYGTNNQVQGVDEADFVKSDGKHVFTAYGDVIFAWDAQDANKGLSITRMPYNDTVDKDCFMPFPEPMPVDVIAVEENITTEVSPDAASTSGSSGRSRKVMMMTDMMPIPCYKPKPQVHSLLLHGSRLTAIVSEQSSNYYLPYGAETSTLLDYQDLTVKVYDAENVPLDGSPLTLLGEKKIKGDYHNARSIDNYGVVITTSQVNTYGFTDALYRYNPQYCGLNSTAYEALAKETALNATESFMEKMVKDLELELDGNCDGIFQVASMQSGNSNEVYNSDLLGEYIGRDSSHRCLFA
jgi:DNA excision repair protein ERCC-4